MKKNYSTLFVLLIAYVAQAQVMNYSLEYIGTNVGTGNIEMALVATPDFTEANGNSADLGAVVSISGGAYLLPTNTGFVNDCVFTPPATNTCDYDIPATEWDAGYLTGPSTTSGRFVYQFIRTPGVTNVFFDAVSGTPIIMAVFQIAGNPVSGDIVLIENTDPLINSLPNEDWLNINYPIATGGTTQDVVGTVDITPFMFSVLSVNQNVALSQQISVYPNPSSEIIYIKGIQEKATISIFDINGKNINTIKNYNNESIDISNLNAGVYLIKVESNSQNYIQKLIVK